MAKLHSVRARLKNGAVTVITYSRASNGRKAARGTAKVSLAEIRRDKSTVALARKLGIAKEDSALT